MPSHFTHHPPASGQGRFPLADRCRTFDAAVLSITQERAKDYGHPIDAFAIAEAIKEAVSLCPDAAVRHALEMIGVKMARLCHTPDHVDSLIDIAGYARTIAMIHDGREERAAP
jgi:hypothetical protein